MPYKDKEKALKASRDSKTKKRRSLGIPERRARPKTEEQIARTKQLQKLYYQNNRERILEKAKIYKKDMRDDPELRQQLIQKSAQWRKNNPEKSSATVRNSTLKNKYGITSKDFDRMLTEQGEECFICRGTTYHTNTRLHVDHCHTTGKVRGLLCQTCNTTLGKLNEDISVLKSMISYLEKHCADDGV